MRRTFKYFALIAILILLSSCEAGTDNLTQMESSNSFQVVDEISNLNIKAFCQDKFGYIWIGTDRGLNKYTGTSFHQYYKGNNEESFTINNNQIQSLYTDTKGRLWCINSSGVCLYNDVYDNFNRIPVKTEWPGSSKIVESNDGHLILLTIYGRLLILDEKNQCFSPIRTQEGAPVILNNQLTILPSNGPLIWIVKKDQLLQMNYLTGDTTFIYDIPDTEVTSAKTVEINNCLWLISDRSLLCFDIVRRCLCQLPETLDNYLKQSDKRINSIYNFENILEITLEDDILFYNLESGVIMSRNAGTAKIDLPAFNPSCMFFDSDNNLWVGSTGHGFEICSTKTQLFDNDQNLKTEFTNINITGLSRDNNDNLWVLATNKRVFYYSFQDKQIYNLSNHPAIKGASAVNTIGYDTASDRLLLGADNHILFFKYSGNALILDNDIECPDTIFGFTFDDNGYVYAIVKDKIAKIKDEKLVRIIQIGSTITGYRIYKLLPLSDGTILISKFRDDLFKYNPVTEEIISLNYRDKVKELYHIQDMFEDSDKNIWLATRDYNVYVIDSSTGEFKTLSDLTCRCISSIRQAPSGNIWISTAYGLNELSYTSNSINHFGHESSLKGMQFNVRCSCTLSDGTIIFGGTHGLTTCSPVTPVEDSNYPLYLDNIKINGTPINYLAYDGLINLNNISLAKTSTLNLKYNQNDIEASFTYLDYANLGTNLYSYYLDGYDKSWSTVSGSNTLRYSNLPPGRYDLRIKEISSTSHNPLRETSIKIVIRRQPWFSLIAWIGYGIVLILLAVGINRQHIKRRNEKMMLERTNAEKEQEQFINKMNINFFANMAHEFRTPLTLLSAPIKQLEGAFDTDDPKHFLIGIMKSNVARMMHIINKLLDFNKLENGSLPLLLTDNYDVVAHIGHLIDNISLSARERNIVLNIIGLDTPYTACIDTDKFDSIILNLFSNAIKFADSYIEVGFDILSSKNNIVEEKIEKPLCDEYMLIHVTNDGMPIKSEELEIIFDRYVQLKEHTQHVNMTGTGIGLYYSRALAIKLKGALWAENLATKDGVRFNLLLPAQRQAYKDLDLSTNNTAESLPETHNASEYETSDPYKANILIVDDEVEIADYIKVLLAPLFNVHCEYDARKAVEYITSKDMPDLVISDIIMPEMSGIELLKSLKNNMVTCHIPVILLTAKVGVENTIEGLDSGAEAYITKPFDPAHIISVVKSILKNRELLKGEFIENTQIGDIGNRVLSAQDKDFINTMYNIMKRELSNSDFEIQQIWQEMNMSRSKLYGKIKNLTGQSPNLLFKTYRLNMASQFLKEGRYNVSEVAAMVGFDNLSYFSKSFKTQFGILPKDVQR